MTVICTDMTVYSLDKVIVQFILLTKLLCSFQFLVVICRDMTVYSLDKVIIQFSVHDCHLQR